jgi:hypothetical protein
MERQNVTLSLPRDLIKKAKVMAAIQDKSLSELMRESLENRVREATGYKKAMARQVKRLSQGLDLGTKGKISITREALHERK